MKGMGDLRSSIRSRVRALTGADDAALDLSRPAGDDGLFGPDSVVWDVHGDFTAMMTGGFAALLLQMLHPAVLAGVWDHSGYRGDMAGRLKRTAQFIAATTYGSTATAEAMIARVRRVHDQVTGMLPDGTPYAASDPALLTWVHVAEMASFLAAHRRYRDPAFAEGDRYFAETATIACRLGATNVPTSEAEVADYLAGMRPAMRFDHRTRATARTLLQQRTAGTALLPMQAVIVEGAIGLLPPWAAQLHGLDRSPLRRPAVRAGMAGVGGVLRWALKPA